MATLAGKKISQNGLGLMRMTNPNNLTADEQAFKVMKAALAAGCNLWNGADFYGTPTQNSLHLMHRYFKTYPEDADKVVLTIKTGIADLRTFKMDCSSDAMRKSVDNANSILAGTKTIDLFGPARVDSSVPIEDTVLALSELVKQGKIAGIQLSEVRPETIRRASRVAKIDMVEAEASLWSPEIFSNGVVQTCAELGIVVVAHTPLGRGMLTGQYQTIDDLPKNEFHQIFPRFQPENFDKNRELVTALETIAVAKHCTMPQLALSWIKSQSKKPGMPFIVPVFGARKVERVEENCRETELTEHNLKEIDDILAKYPVVGTRYPAAALHLLEY